MRGWVLMSKNKKPLVPKLRFPALRDSGEWGEKKLWQLGELVSGLTYSPDDISEEGLLVLRSSNVKNSMITLEDNVYVRPDINGANLSRPNDILICVRNGSKALIGKNAIIPKNMPLCTHGAFMTIFRTESYKFVFQLFQTDAYEKQVAADLGATINSINGNKFKKYVFFVPKLKEQQKIADCLSTLDELITAETQKLEAYKTHKKGLMQQLFPAEGETVPGLRFPEFRDAGEWEEKKLGQIANLYKGKGISKSDITINGAHPCVRYGELYTIYNEVIDKVTSKTNLSLTGLFLSMKGDVIIPASGETKIDIATAACVMQKDVALGSDLNVIRTKHNGVFLSYYLNGSLRFKIAKVAQGDTVVHLYKTQLELLDLALPEPDEQQKIADCLSSLDELITAEVQKIDTLKAHKIGLMQGLFPSADEVCV